MNNIIEKLANADYKAYRCCQCGGDEPCILFTDGSLPSCCVMGFKRKATDYTGLSWGDDSKWELISNIKELLI